MRFFKGLGLFIFSLIIFTLSIIIVLIGLDIVKVEAIASLIPYCFATQTASIITYSVCGVLIFISLICLFGKSSKAKKKEEQEKGVLLANSDGQLLITKQTIENIVAGVVNNISAIHEANSSVIIDNANNVSVKVNATVADGTVIKDVSLQLQSDIKSAIKSATDLEVTKVDVAISNTGTNGQYIPPVVNTTTPTNIVTEEPTYVEEAPVNVSQPAPIVEPTYEVQPVPQPMVEENPDIPTMEEIQEEARREAEEVDAIIASETTKKKRATPKKTAAKKTTAKKSTTAKKTTTRKTTKK